MRIKEIFWSKWSENNDDLSGITLTNHDSQSSEMLGVEKYEIQSLKLQS